MRIDAPSLLDLPPPIEVAVLHRDLDEARHISERLERELSAQGALRDVERDLKEGYPELRIHYRRDALRA